MRLFGSKKPAAPPPPSDAEGAEPSESELRKQLSLKEIEIYPIAVKLLWHFYDAQDQGKEEGRSKELPGPIDDTVNDSVRELERESLIEVVPSFSDFGITAKLTKLGLQVMAEQSSPGELAPVTIPNPITGADTVYRQVNLES